MWVNQTRQRVSTVIVITMVEKNDIIFYHVLTDCHFFIMDNTYVGKPNHTREVLSLSSQWSNRMISFSIMHLPIVVHAHG